MNFTMNDIFINNKIHLDNWDDARSEYGEGHTEDSLVYKLWTVRSGTRLKRGHPCGSLQHSGRST